MKDVKMDKQLAVRLVLMTADLSGRLKADWKALLWVVGKEFLLVDTKGEH